MTDEAQRIAIAKARGWKSPEHPDCEKEKKNMVIGGKWWLSPEGELEHPREIPDYLNDLNAMHEAEKTLDTGALWSAYRFYLDRVCGEDEAISATARQRAEAYLRAINKWVGE
jgi:hypothetical protein